jgi:DNA polymerase-3 subunit delta'
MKGDVENLSADQVEGVPHPRETAHLFGQAAAEAAFLDAFNTGRLHHGWLITGPRGVGKATLAWRIARFLLASPDGDGGMFAPPPPENLSVSDTHPVSVRIAAGSHSGLLPIRRSVDEKTGRLRSMIVVDDVRRLRNFFGLSATDGGRRVVIVDSADEMNPNAANALLKLLEEPPARATLLLIAHQPSGLLPTIRSRCRELRLATLDTADMAAALTAAGVDTGSQAAALAELSGGSVGEAIRVAQHDGLAIYATLITLFQSLPRMNRQALLGLANSAAGRGAEARFDMIVYLFDLLLARLARAGVQGPTPVEAAPGEHATFARLSPSPAAAVLWAELAQTLGARVRHGRAVNLDPASLVLDMGLQAEETAHKTV